MMEIIIAKNAARRNSGRESFPAVNNRLCKQNETILKQFLFISRNLCYTTKEDWDEVIVCGKPFWP